MPGNSSPVLWGDKLFLTGANADRQEAFCYSRASGKLLWRMPIFAARGDVKAEDIRPLPVTGYASPTPATDGARLYVTYASADIAAVDFAGNVLWARNLGKPENAQDSSYGRATSLLVYKDKVIVQFDRGVEPADDLSALLALDAKTGKTVWSAPRPVRRSYCTPILISVGGRAQLVANGSPWIIAYDPDTGKELWRCAGMKEDVAASPTFADGLVYVTNDHAKVFAIRPATAEQGDVTATNVVWTAEEGLSDTPSPVCDGRFFLQANSSGLLTCFDAKSGKLFWSEMLDGRVWASPTLVGDWVVRPERGRQGVPIRDCGPLRPGDGVQARRAAAFNAGVRRRPDLFPRRENLVLRRRGEEAMRRESAPADRSYLAREAQSAVRANIALPWYPETRSGRCRPANGSRGSQSNSLTPRPCRSAADEPLDLGAVDRIVAEIGRERRCALPILQAVQAQYHYLPRPALIRICETTEISPAQIEGVATFYSQFRRMPVGRHLVSVCHGTACHVAGAEKVTEAVRRHLRLEGEADTDSDRLFTVQKVACLGCCSLAPVVRIDDRVYGHVAGETAGRVLEKFLRQEEERARSKAGPERRRPRRRRGAEDAGRDPDRAGFVLHGERQRRGEGAHGRGAARHGRGCRRQMRRVHRHVPSRAAGGVRPPRRRQAGPRERRARYGGVKPSAVRNILAEQLRPAGLLRRAQSALRRASDLLTTDSSWQPARGYSLDPASGPVRAFLAKQKEIVLEGRGEMDPLDIEEYRAHGGYAALEKCLRELSPEAVIKIIEDSGLRGRGGAGFPAGAKWAAVRRRPAPRKCIIMNGDEGDPGAFMDRMMLESYPHRVLEGLAIAAYAVGAGDAFLYIRAEYPLAVRRVREAIRQAAGRGYFGWCGTGALACADAADKLPQPGAPVPRLRCNCTSWRARAPSSAARRPA